ncbi:blast:G2/mitotic-specific cyclin-B [Drosophila guanche]|uniref:Blast:G2/mitotic-specific cyclin-B n=2 Tax=Drosophila guanche TaxID=7266 RepID=A0A3B0KRK2_DROGU|nr:blast:G2/mitotic-specific cyclin-B [Drosophila guanche]
MTDPQQDPIPSNTSNTSNTSNMWPELWVYDDKMSHCKRCGKISNKRSYRGLRVCECWCTSLFDSKPPSQKTEYIDLFHPCAEENFYRLFLGESTLPILENHMVSHTKLTPNRRSVLVNWVHAVHSKLLLCDGVFEMAIGIIDRYLQWVKEILPSDLNLMGLSALILASKYENPRTYNQWFLKHTDEGFTDEMISDMELKILLAFKGDISRPVPSQFLQRLCNATEDFGMKCQQLAHYYVQLALMDTELASVKPSQIAAAALFIALNLSDGTPDGGLDESLWTRQLADCSRYTSLQLRATVLRMAQLPLKAEQEELLSIRKKFKYISVSWVKEILPSDLNLMGLSALILASKYENPRTYNQWFLKHTDEGFTDEMISDMELKILLAFKGDISRPVPSQFLQRLCNATEDFGMKCQQLAHYYVQLALMDTELASVKPSQIAAAALFIALNLSDGTPDGGLDESLWTRQLADCSRYTSLQLRATVLRMAQLPLKAEQEELLSIRKKFKYISVSVGPRLESILNIRD